METRKLPGWLPAMNRVLKLLQRMGIVTGPVQVLTVPGRTSGRPRTTPVSPLTVNGRRYIVAALPQADWARNIRAAGLGELARGRVRRPVVLIEVEDLETKRTVMAAFPHEVPGGVPFFVRLGLVERADPAQFAAASERVAVFEVRG